MSKPLVVSIPHRLGKAEAVRRLKAGLSSAQTDFKHVFTVQEETWVGDSLTFRISALGQAASGIIDVREDHVQMELQLPWLLHQIVEKAQGLIRKRGQLLLENAVNSSGAVSPATRAKPKKIPVNMIGRMARNKTNR